MSTKLLTPGEAADLLAVKKGRVYAMLRRGELPAVHIGRLVRVHPDDLDDWVAHQRKSGGR